MVHRPDEATRIRVEILIDRAKMRTPILIDDGRTQVHDVLLPCCGCGEAKSIRIWKDDLLKTIFMQCAICGTSSMEGNSIYDAIDNWNSKKLRKEQGIITTYPNLFKGPTV